MLHQVRHVFIGRCLDKDAQTIEQLANDLSMRSCVFFVNPDADQSTAPYIIKTDSAATRLQAAMFKDPRIVKDKKLILGPIMEKDVSYKVSDIRVTGDDKNGTDPDDKSGTDVMCSAETPDLTDVIDLTAYEELGLNIRFNNIFDLSPGQKYFQLGFPVTSTSDGKINASDLSLKIEALIKNINKHPYLSKFVVADDGDPSSTNKKIRIVAKATEYDVLQRYPYEPIEFTMHISRLNGQRLILSTGKEAKITQVKAKVGYNNPYRVMDIEKEAQGYRGVANVTAFPVITPPLRTELNREYHSFSWNISRPYHDPTDALRYSSEVVQMFWYMDAPRDKTTADVKAKWNIWQKIAGKADCKITAFA